MANRKDYRVKVKVGDAEVEVEGAESGVVKIVQALSDVLRGSRRPTSTGTNLPPNTLLVVPGKRPSGAADIRSFFADKKPSSDIEAAAAAAYYYQYLAPERDRKETIDSALLQEAFRLAKRPLPARTSYTLTNARNAGYLDSVGEGGQFRLNPVGYNLVEHGLGSSSGEGDTRPDKRRGRTGKNKK